MKPANLREVHGQALLAVVLPQGVRDRGPEEVQLAVVPRILENEPVVSQLQIKSPQYNKVNTHCFVSQCSLQTYPDLHRIFID